MISYDKVKKTILKIVPIHKFLSARSYAQEGEDMVIRSFYEHIKRYKGFYVDVGAHHPFRFSNTKYFYSRGWRGINIEPNPQVLSLFKLFRKRDVNLNIGISDSPQELTYYCFNEPALNGFSKEVSMARDGIHKRYYLQKEIPVKTLPLKQVLDRDLPEGQHIDFLSVDAEGFDLIVLRSNDWTKYRPTFVLVEDEVDLTETMDSEVYRFLRSNGYNVVAKTLRTLIFKDNDYKLK